jgi:hypothetical protein
MQNPQVFPNGKNGTDIFDLADAMFTGKNSFYMPKLTCASCNSSLDIATFSDTLMNITTSKYKNINAWFKHWQNEPVQLCATCQTQQIIVRNMSQGPNFVVFGLSVSGIAINKSVRMQQSDNTSILLPLRGVIYSGDFHFVARFVDSKKTVWFHDGITTKHKCMKEDQLANFTEKDLMMYNTKHAVLAIYGKK